MKVKSAGIGHFRCSGFHWGMGTTAPGPRTLGLPVASSSLSTTLPPPLPLVFFPILIIQIIKRQQRPPSYTKRAQSIIFHLHVLTAKYTL